MRDKQVTAQVPEKKENGKVVQSALGPLTVNVPYAETLKEAKEVYGEEAVLSNAFANWRVTLQSNIRAALKRGESPEEIQKRLSTAKMGVASTGGKIDPEQAFLAMYMSAAPEKKKELLAKLQAKAAG